MREDSRSGRVFIVSFQNAEIVYSPETDEVFSELVRDAVEAPLPWEPRWPQEHEKR
jgi:hypothetical protein